MTLLICSVPVNAEQNELQPRIVETVYPTTDVIVADIVLTESPYNADNTGKMDCSEALQRAIDDLYNLGGGTIFLPVGEYRLCSEIEIKSFVSICGDWQSPDDGNDYGTVIIADVSVDNENPLFSIGGSAGVVGLTVWYPNQSLDNVIPYPYTFYVDGLGSGYMLQSIINCTMLNSYKGIGACVGDGNGASNAHEMLTIENVFGTCLKEGITNYNSADVDTVKGLHFSGKYWAEAGEKFNAPTIDSLNDYTSQNLIAFLLGDLEWPEFADISADSCLYGIYFAKGPRAAFSGTFYDLSLTNCNIGIYAEEGAILSHRGNSWGYTIANGVITARDTAIYDYNNGLKRLTNVKIKGKVKGENIHREGADTQQYQLDYSYDYAKPKEYLYVVKADTTGKSDASQNVQALLNEASVTGGIVYMPAGVYRFDNPIIVPAGVELRGSGTVATRCQSGCSKGTLILSYYGYDEQAKPLITLQGDNSGLYAIRVNYLLNSIKSDDGSYEPTSSAVYCNADNCHIINCFAILSSCGFELENCTNAYLRRNVGCCIDSLIELKDCSGVQIEGCLQNGNAIPRNGYSDMDIAEFENWLKEDNIFTYAFDPIFRVHTDFLKISDSSDVTIFNTFIYGGRRFLVSENSDILLVNVGSDGQSDKYSSYSIDGGSCTVIGTMHSSGYGFTPMNMYEVSNGGKLKMYDRMSVDVEFNMYTRFENVSIFEIEIRDFLNYILQPYYRIYEKINLNKAIENR